MKATFVIGMAGSGKTTLVAQYALARRCYVINLDPAVQSLPYAPNVDIRDAVNYAQLQAQHHLGPNGAILTALSLYAVKIQQLISLCETARDSGGFDEIVVDAPGQIEAFAWSSCGQIIIEAFSRRFPTAVVYLADAKRAALPNIFVSGMLYFLSVKQKLDLQGRVLLCFNKADLLDGIDEGAATAFGGELAAGTGVESGEGALKDLDGACKDLEAAPKDSSPAALTEAQRLQAYLSDSLALLDALSDPELVSQSDFALGFLEQVVTQLDGYWLNERALLVSARTGLHFDRFQVLTSDIAASNAAHWQHKRAEAENKDETPEMGGSGSLNKLDAAMQRLEVVLEAAPESAGGSDADDLDGVE